MHKQRLLIIGCGDIALRAAKMLQGRYRFFGLIRDAKNAPELRALGITPLVGDLDQRATLSRLSGIAELVLHTAPPPAKGQKDSRTFNLLSSLGKGRMVAQRSFDNRVVMQQQNVGTLRLAPRHKTALQGRGKGRSCRRLVYISTSGVYGNCNGELVPETRPVNPQSARAMRRVDAEQQLRRWGRRNGVSVQLLRAPGIYAQDRLPLQRLQSATPVLQAGDDSYTNHIHADDLAHIAMMGFRRGRPGRAYNAADNSHLKMGDYFDLLADHLGLPRPPRVTQAVARTQLPANLLSFMEESRRLTNERVYKELRLTLNYSTVQSALQTIASSKAKT